MRRRLLIQSLRHFDLSGWIAGPEETDQMFCERMQVADQSAGLPSCERRCAAKRVWQLFRTDVSKGTQQVMLDGPNIWQLGYCEIDSQNRSKIALQVGKLARLWGYTVQEVLAHELAHSARCCFAADLFDEFLCYKTAARIYRRVLGPYFSSPFAPLLLLLTSISCASFNLSQVFVLSARSESLICRLYFALLGLQLVDFGRYVLLLSMFARAESKLKSTFGQRGLWFLFRLTQKEAMRLAIEGVSLLRKVGDSNSPFPRARLFADQLDSPDE